MWPRCLCVKQTGHGEEMKASYCLSCINFEVGGTLIFKNKSWSTPKSTPKFTKISLLFQQRKKDHWNLRCVKLQDTKYRTKLVAVTLTSRIGVSKKHFAFMNIQSRNSSICSQVSSFKFMNVFYCKALIGENIYVQAAIFLWIISNWETISLAINDKDAQSWICYLGCWFFFNFSRWEKKKCLCLLALFLRLLNLIVSLMWSHFFLFISI